MSLPHPDFQGFVLAGGYSRRMGRDKALLTFKGTPLIRHALGILRAAGLDAAIAGAHVDLSAFAPIIPDVSPGLGPLSGICSALAISAARYAVFLPVDLPLIPAALIVYLLRHAAITKSAFTAVSVAGFVQTFPAVIVRDAAATLNSRLHSSDRNCLAAFHAASRALSQPVSVLPVEWLLQAGQISHALALPAFQWFLNVNTPNDLVRAESLVLD